MIVAVTSVISVANETSRLVLWSSLMINLVADMVGGAYKVLVFA